MKEKQRCAWPGADAQYVAYHDDEWGVPEYDGRALYEKLVLDGFQAGLSWITILRKREGFRAAFAGFDPEAVARFGLADRARLMSDAGIVRNARKIGAAIHNADAVLRLRAHGGLDALVWAHTPARPTRRTQLADVPATSPESVALTKALKGHGFVFLGPTTVYAAMQACGLVDDHVTGCHRAGAARGATVRH